MTVADVVISGCYGNRTSPYLVNHSGYLRIPSDLSNFRLGFESHQRYKKLSQRKAICMGEEFLKLLSIINARRSLLNIIL